MLRLACFALGTLLVATSARAQAIDQAAQAGGHTVVVGRPGQAFRTPTYVRVSTAGVDFHDRTSAVAFHERLRRAAHRACDSGMKDLGMALDDRRCAQVALIDAVRSVNEPLLTQVAGLQATMVVAANGR